MKFTIPDRSPGASFSRLRFTTELPTTKAKATADKLASILAKRSNGVPEYWSTGVPRRGQLHPLRRLEDAQVVRSGDAPYRFPRLTLGLVRELVRPL